ncbi:MAG: thiol reductase thioredoxin [Polaromonas sp.]|nr:thiol reductase thioredoxin [Polaromonas sp.]
MARPSTRQNRFCRASAPLAAHPAVKHLKVDDRPDRAFQLKRWPTLIVLASGQEVARLVRPTEKVSVAQALAAIDLVGAAQ